MGDKENMDSGKGRAAENPVSRERDKEQASSDQATGPGSEKSYKPKASPPAPAHEYYEVQNGDTLSQIAKERYGNKASWKYVYEVNKSKIKDPDNLEPGLVIELPDVHQQNK